MASTVQTNNMPHAVCVPFPAQGHLNPMMKLAKLLHHRGFHITFVNSEFNHKRLLRSRGPNSLNGLPDFQFESIPDGLPPSDLDATQDLPPLCNSITKACLVPFRMLLSKLNSNGNLPPVSCIVSDTTMPFTVKAADELGIPILSVWTASSSSFLGYLSYPDLIAKGLTPLKDESYLTNGYLDTIIDWIPGLNGLRLKDLPPFIRTTDPNDLMMEFALNVIHTAKKTTAIVINTFDKFESRVLEALSSILPPIYTIGPIHLLVKQIPETATLSSISSNLWKEDSECLQWLNSKQPRSVVYVNFGSITVMTPNQLHEFAWGLANSKKPFVWVIRPDLVKGDSAILSSELLEETEGRGIMVTWCPQEEVLSHPSIGLFLTHSGWNSTIESLCEGIPILCWPFFGDQQTNCWFSCNEWGIGMEIDNNVRRDEVEKLVREIMDGERGKKMRDKAIEWKREAKEAIEPGGSSSLNFENMIKEVLLQSSKPNI